MPGPFYFAWVEPEETTFGPEHHVYDEQVAYFEKEHNEGEVATLTVTLKNPRIGPLSPGRKTWVWLSWDSQGSEGVLPIFFGELIGVPTNFLSDTVQFTFRAAPQDFDLRKQRVADALKERPFYDELWLDLPKRDDPDAVLEGYSRLWHIDPITHEVTTSDITLGEDGTEVFDPSDVPYDSVEVDLSQAPLLSVGIDATVTWRQVTSGTVDMGSRIIVSYSGDGVLSEWPQAGATLDGGWSVQSSTVNDIGNVANAMTANWSFNWQNTSKQHSNGDTMSLSISASEPQLSGGKISAVMTERIQSGVIDPFAVDENGDPAPLNIPASVSQTTAQVPLWSVQGSMILRYDADRPRSERVIFAIQIDLQDIITSPSATDVGEVLSMSGADVGVPVVRLRNWLSIRGQAVSLGDVIFPEYPNFPGMRVGQIATQAGTAGEEYPDFSPLVGVPTADNDVIWASLGPVSPDSSPRTWEPNDVIALGTVILPKNGGIITYRQLVQPGLSQSPQTGVSVNEGQIIQASNGTYHVCTQSGATASPSVSVGGYVPFGSSGFVGRTMISMPLVPTEPNFSSTWGTEVVDGTVTWFSLGNQIPDGAHYYIATKAGTTGEEQPAFNNLEGAVVTDNDVEWTNIGAAEIPVGGVPGNVTRSSYFPTDRGLDSLEYLICVARARLLYRARAVKVKFNCSLERALSLTCRKNAFITDPRIPGGSALGKIMSYIVKGGGDGVMIGTVTIGCTIGRGNTVSAVAGTPCYVDGYMDGVQEYDGQTLLLPSVGDVGYTPPVTRTVDDGLVFPLTRSQVVISEKINGNIGAQSGAISSALASAKQAAQLSEIQAQSAQQSIDLQKRIALLNKNSVDEAIKNNPVWWELVLKPVTNGPFDAAYAIETTVLVAPKMIDLEAAA